MNDLLHRAAEALGPLVERIRERVAAMPIVLAEETSMKIADRDKRGFVWTFHGRDDETERELVLYVFSTDRSGETPAKVLGGTEGTLVVDGYTGYNIVSDVDSRERAGCWSHLRRRFFEARASNEADADEALAIIRELFRVEHEALVRRIVGTDAHLALRAEKSAAIVAKMREWLGASPEESNR
jgi:transposase